MIDILVWWCGRGGRGIGNKTQGKRGDGFKTER